MKPYTVIVRLKNVSEDEREIILSVPANSRNAAQKKVMTHINHYVEIIVEKSWDEHTQEHPNLISVDC